MKIVILGDIHRKWNIVNNIINHELSSNGYALSTGDLCSYQFQPEAGQSLVFCSGNHENFEYIAQLKREKGSMIPLSSGELFRLPDGTSIAALPGVFSSHFYESGEKLKYYSQEDVRKVLELKERVDILISHEAPKNIGLEKNRIELGKEHVNWLIDHLRPRIAFFGHHHLSLDSSYNGCRIVGLNMPHRSYVILETKNFSLKTLNASLEEKIGYRYSWEKKKGLIC